MLADVSLWSADLGNLQRDVERYAPFADSFHIDVADGHFVRELLFFPDLVASLRPHSKRPFHVHLVLQRPSEWIDRFADAGADRITIQVETGPDEVERALARISARHRTAGIAVRLDTPVAAVEPYLRAVDTIVLMGTETGVKGKDVAPQAYDRLRQAAALLDRHGDRQRVQLVADGGIRRHTVPLLREAGADAIVPGSLVFQSDDRAATFEWIHSL